MQHEVGAIVEGKVTGITKFGAFVELEGGAVGMVHISEVSSTYVNDISEHLKENQQVKVKILSVNDDGKISLSIKKAQPPQPKRDGQRPANGSQNARPNNNARGNAPRQGNNQPPQRSSYAATVPPSKSSSFEDMLSKFIQTSDEKNSAAKREKGARRPSGGQKKSRDYDY